MYEIISDRNFRIHHTYNLYELRGPAKHIKSSTRNTSESIKITFFPALLATWIISTILSV